MNPLPDNAATPRPVNFVHPQDGNYVNEWIEGGYVISHDFRTGGEKWTSPRDKSVPLCYDPVNSPIQSYHGERIEMCLCRYCGRDLSFACDLAR